MDWWAKNCLGWVSIGATDTQMQDRDREVCAVRASVLRYCAASKRNSKTGCETGKQ